MYAAKGVSVYVCMVIRMYACTLRCTVRIKIKFMYISM